MKKIAVISSSVRTGRLSHRVALYAERLLKTNPEVDPFVLDLKAYDFPLFHERFANLSVKPEGLLEFTEKFNAADAVVIVSPVYNGSFPASLKNVIDLYYKEWLRRPVGIISVTYGQVPGIATVQQLQNILMKMGALCIPVLSTVTDTENIFAEDGTPLQEEKARRWVAPVLSELLWLTGLIRDDR